MERLNMDWKFCFLLINIQIFTKNSGGTDLYQRFRYDVDNNHEAFCSIGTFRCANDQCIALMLRCDGFKQCDDGSDELNCRRICSKKYFQCMNEKCILPTLKCNYIDDCGDGSDEIRCFEVCSIDSHVCSDGRCVSQWQKCDGIVDCSDASDEKNCTGCNTKEISAPHSDYDNCREKINVPPGSMIKLKCHHGYYNYWQLAPVIRCRNNKWETFHGCIPVCFIGNLPSQVFPLSNKEYYTVGENATIICKKGYFLTTNLPMTYHNLTCVSKNKWDDVPDCVELPNHRYVQIMQKKITIHLIEGFSAKLKCNLYPKFDSKHFKPNFWLWKKGQKDVLKLPKSTIHHPRTVYKLEDKSSLRISSFREDGEGIYVCFGVNDTKLIPGETGYDIKFHRKKRKIVTIIPEILEKGESVLISCPVRKNYRQNLLFFWYKNGKFLQESRRHIVLRNGDLLIKDITVSDKGRYHFEAIIESEEIVYECSHYIQSRVSLQFPCKPMTGNIEKIPWLTTIWRGDEKYPYCYGSVIANRWILTSAFCLLEVHIRSVKDIFVSFIHPRTFPKNIRNHSFSYEVESVHMHKDYRYTPEYNINDIGLIKLKKSIKFNANISPICLDGIESDFQTSAFYDKCDFEKQVTVISGWGPIHYSMFKKFDYRSENLEMRPLTDCELLNKDRAKDTTFCCLRSENKKIFPGDFGAPFYTIMNNRSYLIGIQSWTVQKAGNLWYFYFTKVSRYTSWLTSITSKKHI